MEWKAPISANALEAIAALRDIAQTKVRLIAEQNMLEEQLARTTNDLGRVQNQFADAKRTVIDALIGREETQA